MPSEEFRQFLSELLLASSEGEVKWQASGDEEFTTQIAKGRILIRTYLDGDGDRWYRADLVNDRDTVVETEGRYQGPSLDTLRDLYREARSQSLQIGALISDMRAELSQKSKKKPA